MGLSRAVRSTDPTASRQYNDEQRVGHSIVTVCCRDQDLKGAFDAPIAGRENPATVGSRRLTEDCVLAYR